MIPTCFLQVEPHHRIIDMCAAPGSKTAQLLELLHANDLTNPPTGVVVANDVDVSRCYTLIHQVQRLSSQCVLVTNHEAQGYPYIKLPCPPDVVPLEGTNRAGKIDYLFDRVLCDVPCSGDGTFRKNLELWKKWTQSSGFGLHNLQVKITIRGAHMLKVGGRMVYSTCSMNPVEDEAVVATVLKHFQGKLRLVDVSSELPLLKRLPGIFNWKIQDTDGTWYTAHSEIEKPHRVNKVPKSVFPPTVEDAKAMGLDKCMRVLPHLQNTGGFFIAVLEKVESSWTIKEIEDEAEKPPVIPSVTTDTTVKMDVEETKAVEPEEEKIEAVDAEEIKPEKQEDEPRPPKEKKEGKGKRTEDPFLPFKVETMKPVWDEIKKFFGVKDNFPMDQLFVRSETMKSFYFVSPNIKDMLLNDDRQVLRVINTGIKIFVKHESKDLTYETKYRICSEGVKPLLPYLDQQRVVHITDEDLNNLLTTKDPFIKTFSENAKNKINAIASGSLVVVLQSKAKPEWDGFCYAAWKGKVSVHLLATKEELNAIRLLLNLPIDSKKQNSKEKKRGQKPQNAAASETEKKAETSTVITDAKPEEPKS